jgi:hypothetical protein
LTPIELIIGDAQESVHEARNFVEAIWMAMAEVQNDVSEPIRQLADAARDKLDAALAKLDEKGLNPRALA